MGTFVRRKDENGVDVYEQDTSGAREVAAERAFGEETGRYYSARRELPRELDQRTPGTDALCYPSTRILQRWYICHHRKRVVQQLGFGRAVVTETFAEFNNERLTRAIGGEL